MRVTCGMVATAVGLAVAAVGCGGASPDGPGSGGTDAGNVGFTFSGGTAFSDTIRAIDPTPVTITLRDSSRHLAAGVEVHVQSTNLFISQVDGPAPAHADVFVANTDSQGQIRVNVQLGYQAGPALLEAFVARYNFSHSQSFTVKVGSPKAPIVNPSGRINGHWPIYNSVAMTAGGTFPLDAYVGDAGANRTTARVTFAAVGGVSVNADGVITAGATPDTGVVYAVYGGDSVKTRVSVLPPMRVAAYRLDQNPRIVLMNGDTTAQKTIAMVNHWIAGPVWAHDGTHVAYIDRDPAGQKHLYVADTLGHPPVDVVSDSVTFDSLSAIAFAAGDSAVLVVGSTAGANASYVYRMNIDGSHLVSLTPGGPPALAGSAPMASADGRYVMFMNVGYETTLVTLSPLAIRDLACYGQQGAFSPDGTSLACELDRGTPDGLWVSDLAGANIRQVGELGGFYIGEGRLPGIAFTGGGKWIAVNAALFSSAPVVCLFPVNGGPVLWTAMGVTTYGAFDIRP